MSDEPKRELLPGEAEADAWIDTLEQRADAMSDDKEAQALRYATRLLEHFVAEHFPHNPDWKPLPDLIGVLTQLDNAITIARDYKERLRAKRANAMSDEIERLTAENARLVSICNGTVWEDNERLREENRKLRAALSQQYATTASLLRSDQMP